MTAIALFSVAHENGHYFNRLPDPKNLCRVATGQGFQGKGNGISGNLEIGQGNLEIVEKSGIFRGIALRSGNTSFCLIS